MTVKEEDSAKSGMTVKEGDSAESGKTDRVRVFTQDFADATWLKKSGINCEFGLLPLLEIREHTPAQTPDQTQLHTLPATVILFLPREKERLEFLLHFLACHLPAKGTLWLVGENKAGIKSAGERLGRHFAQVKKADAARHCVVYQASSAAPKGPFSLEAYRQPWTLPTSVGDLKLQSLPGAFAHGRLDKGTALLLEYLQNADSHHLKIKGKVLDFGCGSGVIGIYLNRQYPHIELEMLDTSAVALESTRLSLQLNGCVAKLTASDGLDGAKGRYDWIISNPPFHKGIATDFDIARRFISNAPSKLGNRGRMLLVCNRHLPYETWLTEAFVGFEKVAENREFKVLLAHGPRKAGMAAVANNDRPRRSLPK